MEAVKDLKCRSDVSYYRPNARPGSRAPHAWFTRDAARISTHQLLRPGRFLLLVATDAAPWRDAQGESQVGVDILSVRDDLSPVNRDWQALCGVGEAGAILIRPDGHVAMRAVSAANDHRQRLMQAIKAATGGDVIA